MKKILALFLALSLVCAMAACSTKTEPAADTPAADTPAADAPAAAAETPADAKPYDGYTLTFSSYIAKDEATDVAFWSDFFKPFEEETGAKVDVMLTDAGNITAQQIANLSAGAGPDVYQVGGGNQATYVDNGFAAELDSFFTDEQKSEWMYYENELTNGGHYMVPFIGGAYYRVVFMNKTLCEELGLDVPAYDAFTWDTLLSYGQKAVEAGYKGYVAPWIGDAHAPMCNYVNFLYQAGGSILDENGDYNLDSPESVKAMGLINDMFNTYQIADTVNYNYDAAIAEFNEGNALFLGAGIFSTSAFSGDFEIEAYHMQGARYGCANGIEYIAINSASEHVDAAAALVSYIMKAENWSKYNDALWGGSNLILNSVDNSKVIEERFAHLTGECDNFWTFPSKNGIAEVVELMITHEQLVAMGDETPEQACQAMQEGAEAFAD